MLATLILAALAHPLPSLPAPQEEPTAGVDGRFLLPSGEVAEGAKWRVHGWGANTARKLEYGEPEDWEDPTGWLGDDGRLRARFRSPQAYQFTLDVSLEGYVTASYRWSRIEPEQVIDVGEVTLRPAGKVTGTIVDKNGKPLTGRTWVVYAKEIGAVTARGREATFVHDIIDTKTGRFELGRLPAGTVELEVVESKKGSNRTALKTRARIVAGETLAKDLVIANPDADANKIRVRYTAPRPYHSMPPPLASHIWLVSEGGTRRSVQGDGQPWTRAWTFEDVDEATYRVEIDDPRFDPFVEDGVRRGDNVRARLTGSSAIRLDVRDASGATLDLYQVDLTFLEANFGPDTFRPADGRTPLERGLLDHLVPFDYGLTVKTEGLTGYARVEALAAGETRDVRIDLRAPAIVSGVVRYPDGTPAGTLVRLVRPAKENDTPMTRILPKNTTTGGPELYRWEVERVETGDDGAFSITIDVPGPYLVVAGGEGAPRAESAIFDTATGDAPGDLEIELERGGVIDGRVVFPEGRASDGRGVWYQLVEPDRPPIHFAMPQELDDEGRFRLGPLEPGTYELFVDRQPPTDGSWSSAGGLSLGKIDVVDGEIHEAAFDFPGGKPVPITFDLTPTEVDGEDVVVAARDQQLFSAISITGTAPRVGPIALEPFTYDVWFQGDGWLARLDGFEVAKGEGKVEVLDLDLWTRRVRVVVDGKPLANTDLRIQQAPKEIEQKLRTDADGWVELRLGAATYELRLATREPRGYKRAAIEWPLGEGVEDIVFR